tara:strand:+ start:384 stop:1868 length:1485 start_codon:yes stop_codon:yes gene_type:complete
VFGNIFRGGITFISVSVIARGLGVDQYGELAFLLSSFAIIRGLLEMGTSSAFFTFLSQRQRNIQFVLLYLAFQVFQFSLPLLIVACIFPKEWIDFIWLGSSKSSLFLGFTAVFLQLQTWLALVHIGESNRLTERVQVLNVCIAAAHLLLVIIAWQTIGLSIELVFGLVVLEYLVFLPIAWRVFLVREFESGEWDGWGVLKEYRIYCMPLIPMTLLSFGSNILDRWFLQYFGGSKEQAFYSIGLQFSTVCLLLTTSMLRIFWKEISEALKNDDLDRVQILYKKTCRTFFISTVVFSGFLIPWSKDITQVFLGHAYLDGAAVLATMFFYPIHVALNQICITMLMASSKTRLRSIITFCSTSISLPISYFVLATPDALVPGFGLGAVGMAWKVVLLNMILVNLTSWLISRSYEWKFDWVYQVVGLSTFLFLGWFSFEIINELNAWVPLGLIIKVSTTLLLYSVLSGMVIWAMPWLICMTREELKTNISFVLALNRMK